MIEALDAIKKGLKLLTDDLKERRKEFPLCLLPTKPNKEKLLKTGFCKNCEESQLCCQPDQEKEATCTAADVPNLVREICQVVKEEFPPEVGVNMSPEQIIQNSLKIEIRVNAV